MQENIMCINGKSHDFLTDNLLCINCGRNFLEIKEMITRKLQNQEKNDIRCSKCNKMLATVEGDIPTFEADSSPVLIDSSKGIKKRRIEIKCPRCKTLNEVVV